MKPVSVQSFGAVDQIHRTHSHRLLAIEVVAENTLEHSDPCHLVTGGFRRLVICDQWWNHRFLAVDGDEVCAEVLDLRIAEVRHAGVHVSTHRTTPSNHIVEPVRLQLVADSRQGRGKPSFVAEQRVTSREEIAPILGDTAHLSPGVAGGAAEGSHRQVDSLMGGRIVGVAGEEFQRCLQIVALLCGERVSGMRLLCATTCQPRELGPRGSGTIFMTVDAAELLVEFLAHLRRPWFRGPLRGRRKWLPVVAQQARIDGTSFDSWTGPFQLQDGIFYPLEVRDLDAMETTLQEHPGISLDHLLALVVSGLAQIDDVFIVDSKPSDVIDLQEEVVLTTFLDTEPAGVV